MFRFNEMAEDAAGRFGEYIGYNYWALILLAAVVVAAVWFYRRRQSG